MAKSYHITANGDAKPCRATRGRCPFGAEWEHFSSAQDARESYEQKHAPVGTKSSTVPPKVDYEFIVKRAIHEGQYHTTREILDGDTFVMPDGNIYQAAIKSSGGTYTRVHPTTGEVLTAPEPLANFSSAAFDRGIIISVPAVVEREAVKRDTEKPQGASQRELMKEADERRQAASKVLVKVRDWYAAHGPDLRPVSWRYALTAEGRSYEARRRELQAEYDRLMDEVDATQGAATVARNRVGELRRQDELEKKRKKRKLISYHPRRENTPE